MGKKFDPVLWEKIVCLIKDGYSVREISEKTNVPVSTIRWRIHSLYGSISCIRPLKKEAEKESEKEPAVLCKVIQREDKIQGLCHDYAYDCTFNEKGFCKKCECTTFKDENGLRDVCPHYKRGKSAK